MVQSIKTTYIYIPYNISLRIIKSSLWLDPLKKCIRTFIYDPLKIVYGWIHKDHI
jgi:hypothetical protein